MESAHHEAAHHVDVKAHVRKYMVVFAALFVGTILTVAASYIPTTFGWHVTIALAIASVKAILVAAFFMHLISETKVLYSLLIMCVCTAPILVALPLLTHEEMAHHPEIRMHLTPPASEGGMEGAAAALEGAHDVTPPGKQGH